MDQFGLFHFLRNEEKNQNASDSTISFSDKNMEENHLPKFITGQSEMKT